MEDLAKMCRVCMGESMELVDIYDNKSMGDKLSLELENSRESEPTPADLFKNCSDLPVSSGDGFPEKVCEPCLMKMREALRFKRRYAKSIAYLERVKAEKIDQEISEILEFEDWDLVDRVKSEDDEEENKKVDYFQTKEKTPKEQEEKPRPFKCPDCPKTFTGKAQLTMHSRIHTKGSKKKSTRPKRGSLK
ncbi:uncharacterized protein LOC108086883 [Drosophila ficusphila]|uniref:uncharacterized protein LOC108086883 n=1 Tax=Drosophila ficusphila TaxID=30025 RepID=UPI0007E67DF0|nr:uncharacterized protein LOC108086883 [Drosophila ficusphila]